MADKEATVLVVDLAIRGRRQDKDQSNFEWALEYIWDKISSKVLIGRKTDVIGIVAFRSDVTKNDLFAEDAAYNHIAILAPIQQFLAPQLSDLRTKLVPSRTVQGDVISALVVGLDMLLKYCRNLKYIKNLIIITDGLCSCDMEGCDQISARIRESAVNLSILGIDFDDASIGFKEENKPQLKMVNENALCEFCQSSNGIYASYLEAYNYIQKPRPRLVRPVPVFKGELVLGDRSNYEEAIVIPIERYPKVKIAKPMSASKYSIPSEVVLASGQIPDSSHEVRLERVYKTKQDQPDDEASIGEEVPSDSLERGYTYGRTIVPITQSDMDVIKYHTETSCEILGFFENRSFKRFFGMSETCLVIGQKSNERAQIALSSLIHTLNDLEMLALARLVVKDDRPPVLIVMSPFIESEFEALIDMQVPFHEDVRSYRFAPLDRVITFNGKILKKHRNIPTEELDKAMSDYVDAMDISKAGLDEEGNPREYLLPEDVSTPTIQRINQAVAKRAIEGSTDIPSIPTTLLQYAKPPEHVLVSAEPFLKRAREAFFIRKVDPFTAAKVGKGDENIRPVSGMNIEELLREGNVLAQQAQANSKRVKSSVIIIGLRDPSSDFVSILETNDTLIEPAFREMFCTIRELIETSHGTSTYEIAYKALKTMREQAIDWNEVVYFNSALKELRRDLLAGTLGGNRSKFWELLQQSGDVTLINADEVADNEVEFTPIDSKEFLQHVGMLRSRALVPGSGISRIGSVILDRQESSIPAGKVLKGINVAKGREDPVALADEKYPHWLWNLLDVEKTESQLKANDGKVDSLNGTNDPRRTRKWHRKTNRKAIKESNSLGIL